MQRLVLVWAGMLLSCLVWSQQHHYLDVGDRVPRVVLRTNNFQTGERRDISLQDPGKKLTILCFWASWSKESVQTLPLLEKLHNDSIQVVLVNTEEDTRVNKFLAYRRETQKVSLDLPCATRDSLLDKHIFIPSLPHCVWLNQSGVVRAITTVAEVNPGNVAAALANDKFVIVRRPDAIPWSFNQVLFAAGNGGNGKQIKTHSVLSKHVDGLMTGDLVAFDSFFRYSVTVTNLSIKEMYQLAYQTDTAYALASVGIPDGRTIISMKDSARIVAWINGQFNRENTYVYQLWSAVETSVDNLRQMMREDLDRYFGLQARIVKKKMPVWVLRCNNPSLLKTKGGKDLLNVDEATGIVIKNNAAAWVTRCFYDYMRGKVTVDESGLTGNVDFVLHADLSDMGSVNAGLRKLGMSYKCEERFVDVLELKDPAESPSD